VWRSRGKTKLSLTHCCYSSSPSLRHLHHREPEPEPLRNDATTRKTERERERESGRERSREEREQNGDLLRINDALATLDCSTLERVGARATRARERAYKCVCSSVAEQWSHSSVLALSRSCSAVCGSRSRCAYRSRNRAGCVIWSSLGVYVSGGESVGCLERGAQQVYAKHHTPAQTRATSIEQTNDNDRASSRSSKRTTTIEPALSHRHRIHISSSFESIQ